LRGERGAGTNGAMARALLAALALLLAACGRVDDARAPFLESRTPPSLAGRFYPPEGWAWGLVKPGAYPEQRYGVGSPPVVPRADVLIVPGFGESAETWFETAGDLIARGTTGGLPTP
jgi:lysophospholipase